MVAGNWKMNGTPESAAALVDEVLQGMSGLESVEVVLCPPFTLIPGVVAQTAGAAVACGAQNLAVPEEGAYTGEVSGRMIEGAGCRYVIVGHSERRALYGESNEVVAQKFARAQDSGLVPILCVGETLEERKSDQTCAVIEAQLQAVTDGSGIDAFASAVIAYEPVWAIGTGHTATPDQAQEIHAFIRDYLRALNAEIAAGIRILYGGSVKAGNAAALFGQPDIDGGLIGGASLQAAEFLAICEAA